jgi:hypothetical protein
MSARTSWTSISGFLSPLRLSSPEHRVPLATRTVIFNSVPKMSVDLREPPWIRALRDARNVRERISSSAGLDQGSRRGHLRILAGGDRVEALRQPDIRLSADIGPRWEGIHALQTSRNSGSEMKGGSDEHLARLDRRASDPAPFGQDVDYDSHRRLAKERAPCAQTKRAAQRTAGEPRTARAVVSADPM